MALTYPPIYEAQDFANTASVSVSHPTGMANGDWVFLVCVTDTAHTITAGTGTPTGFHHWGTVTDDSPDSSLSFFSKYIADAGAEGAWTITFSDGSDPGTVLKVIVRGGDPVEAVALNPSPQLTGATFAQTDPATASHTPAVDDCIVCSAFGSDPGGAVTGTPGGTGGTWEEGIEHTNGTSSAIYAQHLLQTSAAAAVGQPTALPSDRWNRVIWSVAPATGGGGPAPLAVYIRDALLLDE